MKIILWDIDGTLLRTAWAGLYAFEEATKKVLGDVPDLGSITTAGMTDYSITGEILLKATGKKPSHQEITDLLTCYESLLPKHLSESKGYAIRPVEEILDYLDKKEDYVSALLTGNTLKGAEAKLSRYQINHFFDYSLSAFGDNELDRAALAANAYRKITAKYPGINPLKIFVIGDTPNDIRCGKLIGASTVAVATGVYKLEELEPHDAWWLTKSLPGAEEFAEKLESVK